jgi:cytochrome P450
MAYQAEDQMGTPVTDWANDWDWLDDQWGENAIEIWTGLHRAGVEVASTERYGRAFMPLTMEAVRQVANDTEAFSSIFVSVARPDAVRRPAPPITSDPPEHKDHRRLLLPAFSPQQIAPMEKELRDFCRSLIAEIGNATEADAAEQFAQHIPVHAICQMVGIPESDADLFRDWIYRTFQVAPRDNAERERLFIEMTAYWEALIEDRIANPREDLATVVANAEINGELAPIEIRRGYLSLLLVAGIDTTWSAIGSGLWHLATHPEHLAYLGALESDDDPRWEFALEEILRFYSPVTMGRKVVTDTEVAGCPMRSGEQTLVTFPAANHDPAAFENAHEFQIDRSQNRHVAFGVGIHRCLGSNLARLELKVAIQEWVRAFPDYSLNPQRPTTWANGQVRGPRQLPVVINRRA